MFSFVLFCVCVRGCVGICFGYKHEISGAPTLAVDSL